MIEGSRTTTIDDCHVSSRLFADSNLDSDATFTRMASGVTCTFEECYYTQLMGGEQGEAVFREVLVSDGCKAEIISEPTIDFDGVKYWQNGAVIQLTIADDAAFNHWETNGSCYMYQDYLNSATWKDYQRHIIIYNHTFSSYAFNVNGASYNCMFNTAGDPIKNDADGHSAIMQQIRFWNADSQQFTASSLLSTSDKNSPSLSNSA